MTEFPLRILIVDDTAVYRRLLVDVVESLDPRNEVSASPSGRLALARLQDAPADLVLLDVEMPDLNGLDVLRILRREHPGTSVVMVSGTSSAAASTTMAALGLGALEFVRKPEGVSPEASRAELRDHLRPLLRLVSTRKHLREAGQAPPEAAPHPPVPAPHPAPAPSRAPTPPSSAHPHPGPFSALAIGVSTGGPNALSEVIPALPADLGVPVLLVQHMPPLFTASLAEHLDKTSKLRVREAVEGEPIQAGTVYLAPGGRHMVLRRTPEEGGFIVGLNENPPENSCRPSVDVLFRSMAAHCEGDVLAVVMTGMGNDGLQGVRALKRHGCHCLTQSEATCVVYGMPMAVDEAGLSDEQVPLPLLAPRIAALLARRRPL
jgi:two-component system, chemotaxis family, protein-glutamate methylesterase/glutaminase